MKTWCPRPD